MNHLLKIILVCVSCTAISCGKKSTPAVEPEPVEPEIVFCNGFEDGNFNVWDDYDDNSAPGNVLLADPGPHNKPGNHVLRLRVAPGRGGSDLVKIFDKEYDKLYARWYVQWEPGYDFNALNHGSGLRAGARSFLGASGNRPDGENFASANFEPHDRFHKPILYSYYRGMYQDCRNPNGSCWGDNIPCLTDQGSAFCTNANHRPPPNKTPPTLVTGKWYRVEIMMDMGKPSANAAGANGVLNMWVDGVEYGPWKDMWYRTSESLKLTSLWLRLYHHGEHSEEGILIDDVVVSNVPIGDARPCN